MKMRNKKSTVIKKRTLFYLLLALLLLIGGAGAYVYGFGGNLFGFQANSSQAPTIKDVDTTDGATKSNNLPDEAVETGEGKPNKDGGGVDPDGAPDTSTATLDASIPVIRQDSGTLQIHTLIQEVVSTGSCNLTLTKDGVTVTRSVGIQPLASSSTCKGFVIPVSELSKGNWSLMIDISANNKKAHLTEPITIT